MERDIYFAELVVPHTNCPLLKLKEKYDRLIKDIRIIPVLGRYKSGQHEICISTDPKIFRLLMEDIRREDRIELVGDISTENHLVEIYCNVRDDVLRILNDTGKRSEGLPVMEYKLLSEYKPLGHPGEYFYLSIPSKEFFVNTVLNELRVVSFKSMIDWRVQKGWKKRRIPFLTLTEQYMADYAVECGYADDLDKRRLAGLSEELKMNLDEVAADVDKVLNEICFRFLKETREFIKYR